MKHILFLYPAVKNVPNGGLKNIYDYANMLSNDKYFVSIVYAVSFESIDNSLIKKIKSATKYLRLKLLFLKSGYTWYHKEKNIHEYLIWEPKESLLLKADAYIATAVCTAPYIAALKDVGEENKFYYIQGYEDFIVNDDHFIKSTYKLPLRKIVVSKWLERLVEQEGEKCLMIPNGFNFHVFRTTVPIEEKDKYTISMLYHTNPSKGYFTGIEAVKLARKKVPQIKLLLFGAYHKPAGLEKWVEYYYRPTLDEHLNINNRASIYVGCSQSEGWGLTVGEAMMCGQAVVCTDNNGYREMAINYNNALVAPIGDVEQIALNIEKLILNDKLRIKIAHRGYESIKRFDINKSYKSFRDYILKM